MARFFANFMKATAYRGNFWLYVLLTALESMTVYIAIAVLFLHVETIAGWSYHDMLVLSGIFIITNGLSWILFHASVMQLDQMITSGDLDGKLTKPVDAQFLVSVERIDIEDVGRSFVGIGILWLGLRGTPLFSFATALPFFLIMLVSGQIILYSIMLLVKVISFASIQGWSTNAISWRFHDLSRYPTDIYTGMMRVIYTFVFPLVFIATVPAKALIGRLTMPFFFGSLVAAAMSFAVVRFFWVRALQKYTSASS